MNPVRMAISRGMAYLVRIYGDLGGGGGAFFFGRGGVCSAPPGCFYTPEKNLPFSFYIAQLAQLGPWRVLCGYKKRCVAVLGLAAGLWRQMGQEAWASAP